MGNLANDTLENIWNNSEKIKWLRGLKMKDMVGGECCKCDKAAFCAPYMVHNANESLQEIRLKSTVISALLLQRISRLSLTGERRN